MGRDRSRGRLRLLHAVDPARDHLRGAPTDDAVVVVAYEDFFCPYCRRLRQVFVRLRAALGDRLVYVVRHFPNERAHPGAELAARAAEAAARQGRFDQMHDRLYGREPPIGEDQLFDLARDLQLDIDRFARDLASDQVRARVEEDLSEGRQNGVTGTPTMFIDGLRYDGAWDFHSMLEALERPVAARVHRSARVFASLPTSAGLVLLVTAALALLSANTALAPIYERVMNARVGVGPIGSLLSLTVRDWFSEGLLAIFFLLVGLEIRREMTTGALVEWRAAVLPIAAALGGVVTPALIYLAFNRGPTSHGWSIPTATDVAFALGLLAVLGDRIPASLRVFVAALAVVDDVLSVLTLAIFYPRSFAPVYSVAVLGALVVLFALNRTRVYRTWPYVVAGIALWVSLHALGVHAALAGVLLAMCLPTRPAPMPAPLLAQAATALAAMEHAEKEARREGRDPEQLESEPVWEWAARNLSAASARLTSPAERIERAVAPWSAYVILPAFAFSASGIAITADFSSRHAGPIFAGIAIALVIGKPLGIALAAGLAIRLRLAIAPDGVGTRHFIGAACLCGIGDTLALLMADRAFGPDDAAVAKLAVLAGSVLAGIAGVLVLRHRAMAVTPTAA
ncbi:MAG TPA: Na+/H+ antiporter NhaA [Kofleriaceae bacterium]|nr:Na+/H+ antiporter NhaA [Kofleriaceae bacterium]